MQGIVLQTGLRPSKDDNEAVLTIMSSETGWDYICQAKLAQLKCEDIYLETTEYEEAFYDDDID